MSENYDLDLFVEILLDVLWDRKPDMNETQFHAKLRGRNPGEVLPDWPNKIDLESSMQALIHIQEVYDFDYAKV
jgi:hypothetical protein